MKKVELKLLTDELLSVAHNPQLFLPKLHMLHSKVVSELIEYDFRIATVSSKISRLPCRKCFHKRLDHMDDMKYVDGCRNREGKVCYCKGFESSDNLEFLETKYQEKL
jgi:hypothetical protein